MLVNLLKIESKSQEVVFLLSLVTAPLALLGAFFYLQWGPQESAVLLGEWGSQFFHKLFYFLGYGTFLFPVLFLMFGRFIIGHFVDFKEMLNGWKLSLGFLLAQIAFLVILASFLSIYQLYTEASVSAHLVKGAGGEVGLLLGGNLFRFVGLFGALSILGAVILAVGIISGQIHLVNSLLWVFEKTLGAFAALKNKILSLFRSKESLAMGHPMRRESDVYVQSEEVVDVKKAVNSQTVEMPLPRLGKAKLKPVPTDDLQETVKPKTKKSKKASAASDVEAADPESEAAVEEVVVQAWKKKYTAPGSSLLAKPAKAKKQSEKALEALAQNLQERLASFGVNGQIVAKHPGIRLTMFEFLPDSGVKLSKIQALNDDLALVLGATSIRILAPIPGKNTVGIEIPNKETRVLTFSELLPSFSDNKKMALPIAMGSNVYNETSIADLAKMPHLLVSGTTGSGKSVFTNSLINSLIFHKSPKDLRMIMIDPKMIELTPYNGIPHLLKPVVSDVEEARDALIWAEKEMDKRYQIYSDLGARNIESFNEKISKGSKAASERKAKKKFDWEWNKMPYIVVIVDELADLMITQGKLVEIPITRIAQKARACGIHLVLATQRPSAEIVTGLIKTNFPSRIAFKVSSAIDSRTILDASGANKLLGNGDMLFKSSGKAIERLQGAFISEGEVNKVVNFISE